jgi:beta-glucosidase
MKMNKVLFAVISFGLTANINVCLGQAVPIYKNTNASIEARAKDLVARFTIEEKASLLGNDSKGVARLGVPVYNWWNEALHGVARAGIATIFPQSIGMAATFNDSLIKEVANVISTEARAKYNLAIQKDRRLQYMGLTFWTPNINIFRDPRWGRGHETYGEDPFLTSKMGIAFVKGLQGDYTNTLKTAATAKHFAVHSGPEADRDKFNAIVDEKDFRETYLYAFRALVDAGVESVMSAYNSINGVPSSINNKLLTDILRKEWGFKGHVVTDCGALDGVAQSHKILPNNIATAAAAVKAGVNLDCSTILQKEVVAAIQQKLLTEEEVNASLVKLLSTQFKLGFFDPKSKDPYSKYLEDSIHNASHIALSRKVAQQSMVLLKNEQNLLPLKAIDYASIMIVGPNATSYDALVGNYHGVSDKAVNFVEGITAAVDKATRIEYDLGCDYKDTVHFGGIWAASNSAITIAVIGLSPVLEGEAGDAFLSASGGDKTNISLPASEVAFMKKLREGVKTPIIAVVTAGSNVDIAAIEPYADAIIFAWYPGEQGGNALADIVFGKVAPSGRLPITFYKSANDLPAYTSYAMKGRTYRYFNGPVQYPFGFGLSYTKFDYALIAAAAKTYTAQDTITAILNITNTGKQEGDEVVQGYIEFPNYERMPIKEMKFFKRISLLVGQSKSVEAKIAVNELSKWDLQENKWKLYPGKYKLIFGGNSTENRITTEFNIN